MRAALKQLGNGLAALHRAGRLHRDVKPSNAMVTHEGRVVLLDFGLVTEFDLREQTFTPENRVVGTVPYMSPEQAAGGRLSPASDWYSVGVMLYEALTGRRPFRGQPLQVLMEKQQSEPPSPRQLVANVPEDLNALSVALLRRDPAQRLSGPAILRRFGSATVDEQLPQSYSARPHQMTFVGRETELQAMTDAFLAVKSGRTAVMDIRGRSGVGKTALVQQFLRMLPGREETVVLSGRCYERESVPYKAFDSLMDALARYLTRLPRAEADALMPRDAPALAQVFPVLRRVKEVAQSHKRAFHPPDRQELRDRAFGALRELLARLGDRKHLVLWIDDLQWGDMDSVALINDLVAPPNQPALLLVSTYRSEDRDTNPVLLALVEPPGGRSEGLDIHQIELQALSYTEARQLAFALIGTGDPSADPLSEAIARESAGNPYFVDALVRHQESGGGGGGEATPGKPVSLEEAIWSRAARLPDAARCLLEVTAVAGHPLRQEDACRAADLSSRRHEAMNALRAAHMIRTTGDQPDDEIEAYHDRIRETVVAHIPAEDLKRYHGRMARVLQEAGQTDPAVLAAHFVGAGQCEPAGQYYALAADQAAEALAFDRAANLYRLAIPLRPAAAQHDLRRKLADALANAGRGADAAPEYLVAAYEADPTESIELRRRAAMQFLISGHIDEGLAELRTVLGAVGMKLPRTPRCALWSLLLRRAQLRLRGLGFRRRDAAQIPARDFTQIDICWSAATALTCVDPILAADFQTRGLLLALRSGEPYRIARSLAIEALHVATAGTPARSRVERLLGNAEAVVGQIDNPHATGLVFLVTGVAACLEGRWKRAVEFCGRSEKTFRDHCTGVTWELDTAQGIPLWALYWLGEIAELARRQPVLHAVARKRGNLYTLANPGTFVILPQAADDPDRAEKELLEFMGRSSRQGFHMQHFWGLWGQVTNDIYCGNGTAAWKRITEKWPLLAGSLLLRVQNARVMMYDARARCALAAAAGAANPKSLVRAAE